MINILFCGNYKVFDGALTELISITNKTSEAVNCFIYTMDVSRINPDFISMSDEQINFLNKEIKKESWYKLTSKLNAIAINPIYGNIDETGIVYWFRKGSP